MAIRAAFQNLVLGIGGNVGMALIAVATTWENAKRGKHQHKENRNRKRKNPKHPHRYYLAVQERHGSKLITVAGTSA